MNFKRYLLTAATILAAGCATAATVVVTWTPPIQNTDDSPIPATGEGSLSSYRIEYGTCNGTLFGTKAGEVTRAAPASTVTLNLQPGTVCVRVLVSNTYGVESAPSNVATRVINPPTPKAPTAVTAN